MKDLWTKYEDHLLNEQLSKVRRKKLKVMFNTVSRGLDLATAERPDVENFINKLNRNKFTRQDGTPYKGYVKQDIKKFLKQFYKWYKGDNEFYPKQVSWLKTRIAKDEKPGERPVIEKSEVPKLAKMFKKYDYQMAVYLQFDSGFRIQELMSVRKRDLSWEDFDEGKKCFWISCNMSKTFTRKIPIPLFTEDITAYLSNYTYLGKNDDDKLFDINYVYYTNKLKEYSKQLFGEKRIITSHNLRHSSATYYAQEYAGNVMLLAQRYGWSYDAKELKTYVRKSGAYNKEGAKVSYKNEILKLKEENAELKERMEKIEQALELIDLDRKRRKVTS